MKKLLLATAAMMLLSSTAQAQVSFDIGINEQPDYYAPAYRSPYVPYYQDRHHDYNWGYWNGQRRVVPPSRPNDHRDDHHDDHNDNSWHR